MSCRLSCEACTIYTGKMKNKKIKEMMMKKKNKNKKKKNMVSEQRAREGTF